MRRLLSALVTWGLLTIAGCGEAQQQHPELRATVRADVLGCYALYGEDGQRVSHRGFYNARPYVWLDSTDMRTGRADVEADTVRLPFEGEGVARPAWYAHARSDTIEISFNDGFSGAWFNLAAPPGRLDTLYGRAGVTFDFVIEGSEPDPRRSAFAVRVPCAADGAD